MSEEPNRKSYVGQCGERARVDSGLRVLPDIAGCTTYGMCGPTLHAQQEPIVGQVRVVDPIKIDDPCADKAADLEEMLPVPAVARQPCGIEAQHGTDPILVHQCQQPLEARPLLHAAWLCGRGRRR